MPPRASADRTGADQVARAASVEGAYLDRHDSYHFFDPLGDLIRTGLTDTNVMDVRVILVV